MGDPLGKLDVDDADGVHKRYTLILEKSIKVENIMLSTV